MNFPLARYPILRSENLSEILRYLSHSMPPHRVASLDQDQRINGYINHVNLGAVKVSVTGIGAQVAVDVDQIHDVFLIHIPMHGNFRVTVNDQVGATPQISGFILSPGSSMHLEMPQGAVGLQIQIGREQLEHHLQNLLGVRLRQPLKFAPLLSVSNGRCQKLLSFCKFLVDSIEDGDHTSRFASGELIRGLLSVVLVAQQNSFTSALQGNVDLTPPYMRGIENFMQVHLDQPISICDLVKAARVSERMLYKGFAERFGTSPMKKLKQMRLQVIRQQLQLAEDRHTTVTEIVSKYQVDQLGRFSAEYKNTFGELPSETLRKSRGSAST